MSGLASLAGYGSDSDDDEIPSSSPQVASSSSKSTAGQSTATTNKPSTSRLGSLLPPPKSGLASKLPAPSTSSNTQKSSSSGLSLPPPSTSTKRKVIKVDSLQSFKDSSDGLESDEDSLGSAGSKKPRLESSQSASSSTKHSLFGMLPAPKRKDDEVLADRKKEADARKAARAMEQSDTPALTQVPIRINEGALRSVSPEAADIADTSDACISDATSSKAKGKNNDAFRAMLGLKPAAKKPQASASPSVSLSTPTAAQPQPQQQPRPQPQLSKSPQRSVTPHVTTEANTKPSTNVETAPVDFFSLSSSTPATSTASSSLASSQSISAAPVIEHTGLHPENQQAEPSDDTSEYPGWQLDPDGSWVPVTPEAHAQLLAYQQMLSDTPSTGISNSTRGASNLDGTRDLLAAGLTPDDIRAFDASTAAREAYLKTGGGDDDADKYAAAADFAAGNRDVPQRKPGMLKGLRKGQLSTLVSLANENRSKLEERWQRGRDAQARRSNRYGW